MKLRQSVFSIVFALLPLGGIAGHSLSRQSRSVSDHLSQTEAKERVKSAQLSSETPQHQLSKKELKTLVASARTANDHHNLATYFERQAQIFDEKSREYQAICVLVAEHPMNYKTKYPSAYDDSRFWQQYCEAKSRKAENEAKLHEQLAIQLTDEKTVNHMIQQCAAARLHSRITHLFGEWSFTMNVISFVTTASTDR